MNPTPQHLISRRRLCLCCVGSATFVATGGWLRPGEVFAEARNLVELIRADAATAPISVHRLRGNVSVLEGSGGNIAVLTGPDGKLLIDGGKYWNGIYPFIDYSTGGSIDGTIQAADVNLAATTERTIIVPGHGRPVSNRAELKEFRDMLVAIRDNVAALKKQGRSLNETIAANPTNAYDAKWGQFLIDPPLFTRLVYEGV